jgi:hypothetical protein
LSVLRKVIFVLIGVYFFGLSSFSSGEVTSGNHKEDALFIESITKPEFKEVVQKGCLACHEGIEEISPLMTEADVNCVTCHLGNPLGTTKEEAHRGMYANPSDFNIIDKTCGQCHGKKSPFPITPAVSQGKEDHVGRMQKSLMATCAGLISSTRYLFGEQEGKGALYALREVVDEDGKVPLEKGAVEKLIQLPNADNSPADNLLRHNCLQCHLYTEGLAIKGRHVGGGCAACHMIYADDGLSRSGDPTIPKNSPGHPIKHVITSKIPTSQCLHCHNGGPGRIIGLGYIGEVPAETSCGSEDKEYRYGTPTFKVKPDLHYLAGMDCIDCHSSDDLHGDGNIYNTMAEQVAIRCETCHGTSETFASLIDERGEALSNVTRKGAAAILTGKVSGKQMEIPQLARMTREGSLPTAMAILPHVPLKEGRHTLECYSCHAQTVTQCYGCHLKRDDRKNSPVDWVVGIGEGRPNASSPGVWSGETSYIRWEDPLLGLNTKDNISPYGPGCQVMFTHIDTAGRTVSLNRVFKLSDRNTDGKRLPGWGMNPTQPHTVTKESRSCESCHTIEKSLGLGLPPGASAQIGAHTASDLPSLERMVDDKGVQLQATSRSGARPFDQDELQLLSRFNVCLVCHIDMAYPDLWKKIADDFGLAKTNKDHEHVINNILRNSVRQKSKP